MENRIHQQRIEIVRFQHRVETYEAYLFVASSRLTAVGEAASQGTLEGFERALAEVSALAGQTKMNVTEVKQWLRAQHGQEGTRVKRATRWLTHQSCCWTRSAASPCQQHASVADARVALPGRIWGSYSAWLLLRVW